MFVDFIPFPPSTAFPSIPAEIRERSGHPKGLPHNILVSRARLITNFPPIFLLSTINSKIFQKTAPICLWIDLSFWSVICGFDLTKSCLRCWSSFCLRFPAQFWPNFRGFEDSRRGFPLKNTSRPPTPESPACAPESPVYTGVSGLRPESPALDASFAHFSSFPALANLSTCCLCSVCVSPTNR